MDIDSGPARPAIESSLGITSAASVPSKTGREHRAMEAAAHNPAIAKKLGIPQPVAREFVAADVGKHFGTHKKGK